MRLCMVSKHFHPYAGGLEARVLELGRWLVGHGEEVVVLTSHEENTLDEEVVDGVEVRRSSVWLTLFNALLAPGILMQLFSERYDVIDVNLPDPVSGIFACAASMLRRKPLFVTYHADIVKEGLLQYVFKLLYYPFLWLTLRRAVKVFVTSPNYAESSPVLKYFMDKVIVASSFVDPRRYSGVDGSGLRKKLALSGKMVLFVGRLVPYKGLEYLIRACEGLKDVTLVIVGDGPLKAGLESMASSNVVFAGRVSDERLPEYYAACDVFALPSVTRQEAFGLVLVEAMASGKPVISTNFSGMPYVVGDAGLLVEPRDPDALREALEKILYDSELAAELSARARKRVSELFTRDVVCSRLLEVYKSAAS